MEQNPYSPPQSNVETKVTAAVVESPSGEPSGIGGWLLLPMLGLLLSPVRMGIGVVKDLLPAFEPSVWAQLTTPGSDVYHFLWGPFLLFELVVNMALIVFAIVLLWLFFRKSRKLPRLFIAWLLAHVAVQSIDFGLATQVPAIVVAGAGPAELIKAAIGAAIWIPYFLKSVRVRNTFTR